MKIVGTIEARMGSTRLPGKTMMDLYMDKPLLGWVVERFRLCTTIDDVVVATTAERYDDIIAYWCESNGVSVFRGSEDNVLNRVVHAAASVNADVVVQMGADSAYLDYQLIDQLVEIYQKNDVDYVCNDLELTYPLGVYGHVIGLETLKDIDRIDGLSEKERSDVVRYVWEHKDKYRIINVTATEEFMFPEIRLTIDYPEDMALAKAIYARFKGANFTTSEIIDLYRKEPEMFRETLNLKQESAPFITA